MPQGDFQRKPNRELGMRNKEFRPPSQIPRLASLARDDIPTGLVVRARHHVILDLPPARSIRDHDTSKTKGFLCHQNARVGTLC